MLLLDAGHKAGNVFEGDQGNVEGVAEAYEARTLDAGVDVQHTGEKRRLVGDDADGTASHARETDHDVAGVMFVNLEEIAVVDDARDDIHHVIGLIAFGRNDGVE